jgi:hypothetical protein
MWSHIVHSGGGLHVYLMFDEPFWIENDEDRVMARKVVKAYHRWANSRCPYDIDSLIDLSRIMRLPGTRHTGKGELCHLVDSTTLTKSVSELLDMLPSVTVSESGHVAGHDGDVDLEELRNRIDLMCQQDLTFSNTWMRKRRFKDKTPSGYCMSLANQLCGAGLKNSEVTAALKMWRMGQPDAKEKPDEWYFQCIGKARDVQGHEESEIKFNTSIAMALTEDDDEQKERVVSEIFGTPFKRFVKVVTPAYKGIKERPKYRLIFDDERYIEIDNTGVLLRQHEMKVLILEELGKVMKSMKGPQYEKAIQILINIMEVEEQEVEGSISFNIEEELKLYINTKIENCEVVRDIGQYSRTQIFEDDEENRYFNWSAFKSRLAGVGIRMSNQELAKILKGLGSGPYQFSDSKRTRLWTVPNGL